MTSKAALAPGTSHSPVLAGKKATVRGRRGSGKSRKSADVKGDGDTDGSAAAEERAQTRTSIESTPSTDESGGSASISPEVSEDSDNTLGGGVVISLADSVDIPEVAQFILKDLSSSLEARLDWLDQQYESVLQAQMLAADEKCIQVTGPIEADIRHLQDVALPQFSRNSVELKAKLLQFQQAAEHQARHAEASTPQKLEAGMTSMPEAPRAAVANTQTLPPGSVPPFPVAATGPESSPEFGEAQRQTCSSAIFCPYPESFPPGRARSYSSPYPCALSPVPAREPPGLEECCAPQSPALTSKPPGLEERRVPQSPVPTTPKPPGLEDVCVFTSPTRSTRSQSFASHKASPSSTLFDTPGSLWLPPAAHSLFGSPSVTGLMSPIGLGTPPPPGLQLSLQQGLSPFSSEPWAGQLGPPSASPSPFSGQRGAASLAAPTSGKIPASPGKKKFESAERMAFSLMRSPIASRKRSGSGVPPSPLLSPFIIMEDGGEKFGFTHRRPSTGVKWGVDFGSVKDTDYSLLVHEVTQNGAMDSWNRHCVGGPQAGKALRYNDKILAVNGKTLAYEMLEEFRSSLLVKLDIERPAPFAGATTPTHSEEAQVIDLPPLEPLPKWMCEERPACSMDEARAN